MRKVAIFIFLLNLTQAPVFSGANDCRIIKNNLTHYRFHGKLQKGKKGDRRLSAIEKITARPQKCLMEIAGDRSNKMYVRIRAVALLKHYDDESTGAYLEKLASRRDAYPSLRGWAAKSYAGAFYKRNPFRARRFLNSLQKNTTDKYLKKRFKRLLKEN